MLMPTSSATSRKVKRRFPRITAELSRHGRRLLLWKVVQAWDFTDRHSALFKTLKPLAALRSAHTVLPVCLVKQLKCLCKLLPSLQQTFTHTHTHTHTRCSSSSFIVTLSLIRRIACARAQFSGCSSTTNAHSETGQMAVCCQNLTLGALSSHSMLPVLVGAIFKEFGLFLNAPRIYVCCYVGMCTRCLLP